MSMKHKDSCAFCGGEQSFCKSSCSFGSDDSYVEYKCADCKSIYRVTERTKETWQRSGHPLSYGQSERTGA